MRKRVVLILLIFASLNLNCFNSPDRKNPLDPKSDNFENVGNVEGTIFTLYAPLMPINQVEIRLQPGPFVTLTNENGNFTFRRVPVNLYEIVAQKTGYAMVKDTIQVELNKTTTVQLQMDGLPDITSFKVRSCHLERWWPQTDLFFLEVDANVQDPDGVNDVERVWLEIPELNFTDTLAITQNPGVFKKQIASTELPKNIHDLVGRKLFLMAKDRAGFEIRSEPGFLTRVIDPVPKFDSPTGNISINDATPTLAWKPITLPFSFTFKVDLFRDDQGIINLVESIENIDPATNTFTINQALPEGFYFWTISVVDEFGNWSRSKEASFEIVNP
ncbi:MAG: carboxypeptidase regulatory-like domain-containing protein [Calditrichaeota bacterium]|nr:MAG: carboxypeptidase regulatory-like domain-containing protein [Calditrichota bacterium]